VAVGLSELRPDEESLDAADQEELSQLLRNLQVID